MKKVIILTAMCVACLSIGAIVGSYITKNKVQQKMEITMHNAIIQELDDFSEGLLEAAVIYYAGFTHNLNGEKFPSETFVVKSAEQTASFVSDFLIDLESQRNIKGYGGEYSYSPKDFSINLIRSESEIIASKFPDNINISKSPWNNDIKIDMRKLPHKGGSCAPGTFKSDFPVASSAVR